MGQKVHPLGFRLGVTQLHRSTWFVASKQYSTSLQEDRAIRDCINAYVQAYVRSASNYGGIANVKIEKKAHFVQVDIHTAFPAMLMTRGSKGSTKVAVHGLQQLRHRVESTLHGRKRNKGWFKMTLVEVSKPYKEAIVLAEYIAVQLESRVAFRRTMKSAIALANKTRAVNGVKIQIAGRLNGAEIARVEWVREGRVPLQTLRAHIDYCHYSAQTIYGVLGIKVWICQHSS